MSKTQKTRGIISSNCDEPKQSMSCSITNSTDRMLVSLSIYYWLQFTNVKPLHSIIFTKPEWSAPTLKLYLDTPIKDVGASSMFVCNGKIKDKQKLKKQTHACTSNG